MALAPADVRRAVEDALAGRATWDRAGDIVFYEDFSQGLGRWTSVASGATASAYLSFQALRAPPLSCRLIAGDPGIAAGTAILTHLPLPILSPIGLEIAIAPLITPNFGFFEWTIYLYDGTNLTFFGIKWSQSNNHLDYFNSAGAYANFATSPALYVDASSPFAYHVGKVVVDPRTLTYRRFILDNTLYTTGLVGQLGRVTASAVSAHMDIEAALTAPATLTSTVGVEDVIVTYNEAL